MSQAAPAAPVRGSRKIRFGTVVSNRMQKTIVVQVGRQVQHQKYQRVVRLTTNFKVHDEANRAKIGDYVQIMETRPVSKDKRWRLIEVLRSAQGSVAPARPVEGSAGPQASEGTGR